MRTAYAFLGILWLIIIIGVIWGINHGFTTTNNTGNMRSPNAMIGGNFTLRSSAFRDGDPIPPRLTCDGDQFTPPLEISGAPKETQSFAIIMEDPDVPKALMPDGLFVHWVLFNIPPEKTSINENESVGISGVNTAGGQGYTGPCPPTQYQPLEHRYIFTAYALDTVLQFEKSPTKEDLLSAMRGHVLAQGELLGRYQRTEK
jgi:Raf kinase inhibitor-like YbhB/YbcL family protein